MITSGTATVEEEPVSICDDTLRKNVQVNTDNKRIDRMANTLGDSFTQAGFPLTHADAGK